MPQNIITAFIEKKLAQPAEENSFEHVGQKDIAKGLVAGLIAGVVATAAKSAAERIYPPRTHGEPEPPQALAEKVAGHELSGPAKTLAAESIHWTFGAAAGAAYGALAEFYPNATSRHGASFGMTLMALTHEGALPAVGLSAQPADQTTREKSSEMVTHLLFGVVTESVRRFVRSRI
jgi:putative membrane protein